jgi:hypothetical protein
MYYILAPQVENDNEDAILEGYSQYLKRIDCNFKEGLSLPSDDIEIPILFNIGEYTLRGTMTDHLSIDDIPSPIFSLKTQELFASLAISNIEYYQLKLIDEFPETDKPPVDKNKKQEKKVIEYNNYFIANVVGLVDCVDHEQSVVEYYYPPELKQQLKEDAGTVDPAMSKEVLDNPNEIDFITKLVLDETKIDPALKVFRLLDQPDLLVFHESVVEAIKKGNLSGFVFVPVAEYTDAIPDEVEEEKEEKQISVVAPPAVPVTEVAAAETPKKETKNKSGFRFLID